MPTGYTSPIIASSTPITLRQYVLHCARVFVPFGPMPDGPLPHFFKPSFYHQKEMKKAAVKLKRLQKMTAAQKKTYNLKERTRVVKIHQDIITRNKKENKRYLDMLTQIDAWNCPADLQPLKDFMITQINVSLTPDIYWEDDFIRARNGNPYIDALEESKNDIEYHAKEQAREIEMTNANNAWLKTLRSSLPIP